MSQILIRQAELLAKSAVRKRSLEIMHQPVGKVRARTHFSLCLPRHFKFFGRGANKDAIDNFFPDFDTKITPNPDDSWPRIWPRPRWPQRRVRERRPQRPDRKVMFWKYQGNCRKFLTFLSFFNLLSIQFNHSKISKKVQAWKEEMKMFTKMEMFD